jgi:hypothetical protein
MTLHLTLDLWILLLLGLEVLLLCSEKNATLTVFDRLTINCFYTAKIPEYF